MARTNPPAGSSSRPRHALAWLRPDAAWRADAPAAAPLLSAWFAAGRPAVVARPRGGEPVGHLRLGVALPPAAGKQRLGLTVAADRVAAWRAPLPLHALGRSVPPDWRGALAALQRRRRALGLSEPAVYGSFAWQALTGLAYVGPGSDLDLAWALATPAALDALCDLLAGWERTTGRRVDGEVLLPGAAAVCWRELAGGAAQVLVKAPDGARLQSRAAIRAALARAPARYARPAATLARCG